MLSTAEGAGVFYRGGAEGAEGARRLHWLDPVETGLAAECGGCGAAHFLLNVATTAALTKAAESQGQESRREAGRIVRRPAAQSDDSAANAASPDSALRSQISNLESSVR